MEKYKQIRKIRAVLFDFDYTLADSSKGIMECINFALNALNLPSVSYGTVCKTIGMSLAETFHTLSGGRQQSRTDEFIRLYTKRADEVMEKLSVLYDSVPPVIRRLKQHGLLLGVVSTKFHYRIEAILKREHLFDAFSVIVGGEDVSKQKPDPEALQLAINTLGISPNRVLYAGDSVIDAETARRANISFVAVLSGITRSSEFDVYSPCAIHKDLYQFADWLLR